MQPIDQATGMLTEQIGVGAEEAFIRLRAYAYAHEHRLVEVAADVVNRRLRFPSDSGPEPAPGANPHRARSASHLEHGIPADAGHSAHPRSRQAGAILEQG